MFGEKPKLTSLETRKQLLLLESDLNRAQFVEAVQDWKDEFHQTKEHLTQFGSMVSLVGRLAATFSTVRRLFSRPAADGGKKSWLSLLFDGMTAGTSLWQMLSSHRRKHDD